MNCIFICLNISKLDAEILVVAVAFVGALEEQDLGEASDQKDQDINGEEVEVLLFLVSLPRG
jgi:hypothetical protein